MFWALVSVAVIALLFAAVAISALHEAEKILEQEYQDGLF